MSISVGSSDKDYKEKLKALEGLKSTVDKQRRDLDKVRKEMVDKDMLCTALRVRSLLCRFNSQYQL